MAEQKKQARTGVARKKTAQKTTEITSDSKVKTPRGKAKQAPEAPAEAGFESLRSAAAEELRHRGQQIAKKLREKSEAGDTQSTKLLIELAKESGVKKLAKGKSVALRIASDPEWNEAGEKEVEAGE